MTSKEKFRKLQLKWYKKLRRSGFKDIEGTSDFNDFPVSTLRSSGGTTHLSWDFARDDDYGECMLAGWDGQSGLGESSNWEYYARVSSYANELPRDSEVRAVLLCFLDKHPRLAGKIPGVSKRRAMSIWTETIKQLGLPPERAAFHRPAQEKPAPVRHLSKKEIKALSLTPPKLIKDR